MTTRRWTLKLGSSIVISGLAGCLETIARGCEGINRYDIKLTEVTSSRAQESQSILRYQHLSPEERLIVDKAKAEETGFYSKCRSDLPDAERDGFMKLGERIRDNTSGDDVFIQIDDEYYQIGLIRGDIYYAFTDHSTDHQ